MTALQTLHNRRLPITNYRTIVQSNEGPLKNLYYHLIKAPKTFETTTNNVFAISYLDEAPATIHSSTILGTLPAFEKESEQEEPGINDFKENSLFLELMHDTIKKALQEEGDEVITAEAVKRGSGWLHIQDERNVPPLGRIGDPDDIIASVMVENGKILPETYQRMPSYRLFTADGPPQLSRGLAQRLQAALQAQLREESKNTE
ncbi:hypothetical protein CPB86DRAFT_735811 [Serendipita vermifera]|nr:hypothetical protein CPB86DRAFT_735811 [Serendipita vermifera]